MPYPTKIGVYIARRNAQLIFMTEATLVQTTPDGIIIDTSKQFKPMTEQCPKCQYFRTWGFKVLNPQTGKLIPGHVTKEGFKIGNGECPYYQNLAKINAKKQEKKYTPTLAAAQNMVSAKLPVLPQVVPTGKSSNKEITITLGSIKVALSLKEATHVAREIFDQITEMI